ncbi:unnamed protein product [Polarella glacialis]|uniref:PrsW family intramembrane metalloprotease n=1 Tax=Polarella glacialis TaxID=89957 RepID=A0A813H1G8_POLGL|nr:unnamed protein product [Polarella glacialis]
MRPVLKVHGLEKAKMAALAVAEGQEMYVSPREMAGGSSCSASPPRRQPVTFSPGEEDDEKGKASDTPRGGASAQSHQVLNPAAAAAAAAAAAGMAHLGPHRYPLDSRTERFLRGGCLREKALAACWLSTYLLVVCVAGLASRKNILPEAAGWLLTALICVLVPLGGYLLIGRPKEVKLGLLVDFFWWGGIGGVLFASTMNSMLFTFWSQSFPTCNIGNAVDEVQARPDRSQNVHTAGCEAALLFQWILTPGLWEEVFKAFWVLWRLKVRSAWSDDSCAEDFRTDCVPRTSFFVFSTACCPWYWRLARTPEGVFLSSLAAGAGFEAIQNIAYALAPGTRWDMRHITAGEIRSPVGLRSILCLQVLWTGFVGIQFAKRLFAPRARGPVEDCFRTWTTGLLPVVLLHGVWDWVGYSSFMSEVTQLIMFLLLAVVSVAMVVVPIARGALRSDIRFDTPLSEMAQTPNFTPRSNY